MFADQHVQHLRGPGLKLIIGVSFALGFLFFIPMGLATTSTAGTFLSSLALAAMALSRGGWSTYHVEIAAPEHAGLLYAFSNTAASAASVVVITLTGKLLGTFAELGQSFAWAVALGATGVICGFYATFFLVSAERDEIFFPAGPRNGKYAGMKGRRGQGRDGWGEENFCSRRFELFLTVLHLIRDELPTSRSHIYHICCSFNAAKS